MEHVLLETGAVKAQLELGGVSAFSREPLLFEVERERWKFCEQRSQLFASGAYSPWSALLSNNAGTNLFSALGSLLALVLPLPLSLPLPLPDRAFAQPQTAAEPQVQQQLQQHCGICHADSNGNGNPSPSPPPPPPEVPVSVRTIDELVLLSNRAATVRRSLQLRNTGSRNVFLYGFAIDGYVCEHKAFRIVDCPLHSRSDSPPGNTSKYLLRPNGTLELEIEFTPDFTLTHVDATLQLFVQLSSSPSASASELSSRSTQSEKRFGERELLTLLEHLRIARAPPAQSFLDWLRSLWSRVPIFTIIAARRSAALASATATATAAAVSDSSSSGALRNLHLNRGDLQEFRLRAAIPRLGAQHCMAAADRWQVENLLLKFCVPILLLLALVSLVLGVLDGKQLVSSHRVNLHTLHILFNPASGSSSSISSSSAVLVTVPSKRAGNTQPISTYERDRHLPVFDLKAIVSNGGGGGGSDPQSEQQTSPNRDLSSAASAAPASGSDAVTQLQSRLNRARPVKSPPNTVGVAAGRVAASGRARNLVLETADAYSAIRHAGALTLLRVLLNGAVGSLCSALLTVPLVCARAVIGVPLLVARRVASVLTTLVQLVLLYVRAICGLVVERASLILRDCLDQLVAILIETRSMVGQRDASSRTPPPPRNRLCSSKPAKQSTKANERPALESTMPPAAAAAAPVAANASATSASSRTVAAARSASSARHSDSNSNSERQTNSLSRDELPGDASKAANCSARSSIPALDAYRFQATADDDERDAQEGGSALIIDEANCVADAPRVASATRQQQRAPAASRDSSKPESFWNFNSNRYKRKAARINARLQRASNNAQTRKLDSRSAVEMAKDAVLSAGERIAPQTGGQLTAGPGPGASSSSADESISDGVESHVEQRAPGHRAIEDDQPTSAITDSEGEEADVEAKERVRKKTPLASPVRRARPPPPRRQPAISSASRRAQLVHRRTNSKGAFLLLNRIFKAVGKGCCKTSLFF